MAVRPANFTVYLMTVFVVNMMIYLTHYILLKTVQHHEEIRTLQGVCYAGAVVTWSLALYNLIFETSIAPGIAPALSREGAKPCIVMEMFDGHDAWHFFSALGIFLVNFLVLILDDCQAFTQTGHLAVF